MTADDAPPAPFGRRLVLTLLAAVACAAASGLATVAIARSLAGPTELSTDHLAMIVIAVGYATVAAVLLLGLGRTPRRRRDWLGLRPTTAGQVGLGLLVWAGAYLAAAVVYLALTPVGPSLPEAVDLLMSVGADNGRLHEAPAGLVALTLFRIAVLSPLVEELIFRGALFGWLRSRLSARWTIVLTAVAFGLVHQSPTFLPLAITVGLAAGWLRERTGSTYVTIVGHSVQSSLVVLISLLVTGWDTPALLG
jgi:membrane protease YdiL (CAAX protease family)